MDLEEIAEAIVEMLCARSSPDAPEQTPRDSEKR
jgi:hypothetical protein